MPESTKLFKTKKSKNQPTNQQMPPAPPPPNKKQPVENVTSSLQNSAHN